MVVEAIDSLLLVAAIGPFSLADFPTSDSCFDSYTTFWIVDDSSRVGGSSSGQSFRGDDEEKASA